MLYLDLFSALDRHRVDYLLSGGLAVSLHGVERATVDVDITVAMSPDNLAHLIETARELKLTPVLPVPLESLNDFNCCDNSAERNLEAFSLRTPEIRSMITRMLDLLKSSGITGVFTNPVSSAAQMTRAAKSAFRL